MPLAAKPVVRGKLAETLVSVAARHVVRAQVALVMGENENFATFWRGLQPKVGLSHRDVQWQNGYLHKVRQRSHIETKPQLP